MLEACAGQVQDIELLERLFTNESPGLSKCRPVKAVPTGDQDAGSVSQLRELAAVS
jgi:hypothetical protein